MLCTSGSHPTKHTAHCFHVRSTLPCRCCNASQGFPQHASGRPHSFISAMLHTLPHSRLSMLHQVGDIVWLVHGRDRWANAQGRQLYATTLRRLREATRCCLDASSFTTKPLRGRLKGSWSAAQHNTTHGKTETPGPPAAVGEGGEGTAIGTIAMNGTTTTKTSKERSGHALDQTQASWEWDLGRHHWQRQQAQ